jgi:hypothetical protein
MTRLLELREPFGNRGVRLEGGQSGKELCANGVHSLCQIVEAGNSGGDPVPVPEQPLLRKEEKQSVQRLLVSGYALQHCLRWPTDSQRLENPPHTMSVPRTRRGIQRPQHAASGPWSPSATREFNPGATSGATDRSLYSRMVPPLAATNARVRKQAATFECCSIASWI